MVAGLLAADADQLWATQGRALHGPDRPAPRWRRTWIACRGRQVVGAATLASNRIHPGRYSCAVEVAPAHRRTGIGRQLLETVRAQRPEPRPLAGKVYADDPAATALAAGGGATVYQRCPCPRLDLRNAEVRRWCTTRESQYEVTRPEAASHDQLVAAFAQQYTWVHEPWSPVGPPAALAEVATALVAEADLTQGAVAWAGGQPAALVLAFREPDSTVDLVAETVRADQPDGHGLLTAAVARALRRAYDDGVTTVTFDGHDTDPHLAPLVRDLPATTTRPLLLMELR